MALDPSRDISQEECRKQLIQANDRIDNLDAAIARLRSILAKVRKALDSGLNAPQIVNDIDKIVP